MKKFNFKGVLDGLRSSVSTPPKSDTEVEENLRSDHFQVMKTIRHGFPFQPTAMAHDPVQHILAIGTKNGSLRIFGRPGVDCHVRHDSDITVIQLLFLINEGALVSVCSDDTLHLWNLRQKRPEIVHSLKFQRERITHCHLPFQSKWLYIGTERGNIHIVNIESFVLSGYVINWNKTIELSRKTHPGPVVHLNDNPIDPNKLLIGYESGTVVLWDLKTKTAEFRYQCSEAIKSVAWHHEGKQFMCSQTDGSLATWNIKFPTKPATVLYPHAKLNKDGKPDPCKPINKVEWKTVKGGDSYIIFSGGLTYDKAGRTPSITVVHGKTTTVLEMEHNVIDFITLCETPWESECQDPYAIVVLLQNDLVVVDLTSPGYPCFENPYPMDIHESPVTCCAYYADCPTDLIPAFYSVGSKQKRLGFSEKDWPIRGGEWGTATCSYPEIIITGHADGSLKFWDASAVTLQVLYKLKTMKIFEKPKSKSVDGQDDDPFAIQLIHLCPESRLLCMAGASGHVILFKFNKQETTCEVQFIETPIIYEPYEELESPKYEFPPHPSLGTTSQQSGSFGSHSSGASDDGKKPTSTFFLPTCQQHSSGDLFAPLKVKSGLQKRSPGYQADLVCLTPWMDNDVPGQITALNLNSSYGLLAYGTELGLVIIDIIQKICLLSMATPDLYGSADPYQRVPRSPKRQQGNDGNSVDQDRCRSPTVDQPKEAIIEESHVSNDNCIPSDNEEKNDDTVNGLPDTFTCFEVAKDSEIPSCQPPETLPEVAEEANETLVSFENEKPLYYADRRGSIAQTLRRLSKKILGSRHNDNDWAEHRDSQFSDMTAKWISKRKRPKKLIKRKSQDSYVVDLRNDGVPLSPKEDMCKLNAKKSDKPDSTFSRSRSSSMSSLDNVSSEAIQCLSFADSYTRKTDSFTCPCLWVGTSLGSVLVILLTLPPPGEPRATQPAIVTPSGTIFRLKGVIMAMSFLDCNGALIHYMYESWKDTTRDSKDKEKEKEKAESPVPLKQRNSPTSTAEITDRQFAVICSERQARVMSLPSQTCAYKAKISDNNAFVIKADVISVKDSVCLSCYLSNGHIMAFSLPSLKCLLDLEYLPLTDLRIARTFCFSNNGHGLYLCSPTEVQKITLSAEICENLQEMLGDLFLPCETPEPPKQGFFKGLFGGGTNSLDREELFGESSGKASRSLAKHIPGSGGLEHLKGQATGVAGDVQKARMALIERGERLGELEDRTGQMMMQADTFASAANQIMQKYRDKKWYQF